MLEADRSITNKPESILEYYLAISTNWELVSTNNDTYKPSGKMVKTNIKKYRYKSERKNECDRTIVSGNTHSILALHHSHAVIMIV